MSVSTSRSLLPALGAGFLFTLGGSGDKVVFAPPEGTTLTRTIEFEAEFSLDEMSLLVDGQDVVALMGRPEITMRPENRIVVTDTIGAVEHGRPLELKRAFDELSSRFTMDVTDADFPEMESGSELEGDTVVFRWNPEAEKYECGFPDDDGDAELLEGLEEDMDLRVFLPDEEVGTDDEWTVQLADLQRVLAPGGDLKLRPEGVEADEDSIKAFQEIFGELGEELQDLLEGDCTCTYKGARDEDGTSIGEIAIQIEVATTLDLTRVLEKAIHRALEESGMGEMVDFSLGAADLNLDFEGTGTLLWNLSAGHARSLHLNGDLILGLDLTLEVEAEGESQSFDASLEFSGTLQQETSIEE